MAALFGQILITNSVFYLKGSTWSSRLSFWLCCKGEALGNVVATHLCTPYSISLSKDKAHQYKSVISSDRHKPTAESTDSEQAPFFCLALFMNMNGLCTPELLRLFFCFAEENYCTGCTKQKQVSLLWVAWWGFSWYNIDTIQLAIRMWNYAELIFTHYIAMQRLTYNHNDAATRLRY